MKLFIILTTIIAAQAEVYLYEYPQSNMTINDAVLRETIQSKYFATQYYLNAYYQPKIFYTNEYYQGTTLLKDYKKTARIGYIRYKTNEKHQFNYVLNLVSMGNPKVVILHNQKEIYTSKENIISIQKSLILNKGEHTFELLLLGNNFCNCPSKDRGYTNTRFFFGWLSNPQENNKLEIPENIFKNILINSINVLFNR